MFKYLRFFGTHVLIFATAGGLLAGGEWYWFGFVAGVVIWIGGDALSGPTDGGPTRYAHPGVLDAALYSLFPSLIVLCFCFAFALSSTDLFGVGARLAESLSLDALNARATSGLFDYLGACLSFGLAMAMGGILTAHELSHRTDDPLALWVARWMLAMAFNSTLEVAHVFGHHRDVGTPADPATARRGESIYRFYIRSSVGQVFQAWRIERARLRGVHGWRFYLRNKVVNGAVRSAVVAVLFFMAGRWFALGGFLVAALWNKFLLESLNYLEHYGLVRVPGMPIEQRHAWDSSSRFSHAVLFNLPRHADHHSRVGAHYPELQAAADAPKVGQGYLASLPLVWIPPLWRRLIAPRLAAWDRTRASPAERALLG